MKTCWTALALMLLIAYSLSILAGDRGDNGTRAGARTNAETSVATDGAAMKGDPLAWLEEPQGTRSLAWVRAQNKRTLDALTSDPRYSRYRESVFELATETNRLAAADLYTGRLLNGWVHNLWKDEAHPIGLWRRSRLQSFLSASPEWEMLLDLDKLSEIDGRRWEFRLPFVRCLESDQNRCLISLSDGARVDGVHREFDLSTRSFVPGGFELPQGQSTITWRDEDAVYVATNVIDSTGKAGADDQFTLARGPRTVRLWRRGQAVADGQVVHETFTDSMGTTAAEYLDTNGERYLTVNSLDMRGSMSHWLVKADGQQQRMTLPPQHGYLSFHRGWCIVPLIADWTVAGRTWPAGALVSVPLAEITNPAPTVLPVVIPGPRDAIYQVAGTPSGVLVASSHNVNGRVTRFQLRDRQWHSEPLAIPDHGTIRLVLTEPRSDIVIATYQSFLQPVTLYELNVATNKVRLLRTERARFDSSQLVTEQLEAVSRDGTRIPYFLVRPRTLKYDGALPTLLKGYGGYNFPMHPMYSGMVGRLWLEQGGAFALANIRGGSEFGPAWHAAAIKANRQRAYDDFTAVAEDLIRRKITSPRRLGIEGMSNGGLLVGVMLTQRPELFHAAVAKVPVLDVLRFDLLRGGEFTANELGSPDIPEERAFLERTSPYQNLRLRSDFPVPLLITATNDDNVHPAQARKYAAKLEQLGMPFFFYEASEGGHSASMTPAGRAQKEAIEFVYLARRLID